MTFSEAATLSRTSMPRWRIRVQASRAWSSRSRAGGFQQHNGQTVVKRLSSDQLDQELLSSSSELLLLLLSDMRSNGTTTVVAIVVRRK